MTTQQKLDLFHNVLRSVVSRRMDDFLTKKFNRIFCRTDLAGELFLGSNANSLFPEFDIQARRRGLLTTDSVFWCAYIEALMAVGRNDDAIIALKQILNCSWGISSIKMYLPLMRLAYDIGIKDIEIKKGAEVFARICESVQDRTFERFFSAEKTVALVGNGPIDNGKCLGSEIDGHDVVIRINNYAKGGFECDYGKRTDIWVKASFQNIDHNPSRIPTGMIYYADEFLYRRVRTGYVNAMFNEMQQIPIGCYSSPVCGQLIRRLGILPTTGFSLISILSKLPIKYLDVYGFSFLSEAKFDTYESFDGSKQDASAHNMHVEIRELLKLPWRGRRLYCGLWRPR